MTDNTLSLMIMRHEDAGHEEGTRFFPYKCPADKLTLGWGRNIEERGISEEEAMLMLHNDIQDARRELAQHFGFFDNLDSVRQTALIDLHFNMGYTKLSKFVNMIAAFYREDYESAADEAKDSSWYNQVGDRGIEIVHMIRTGTLKES